MVIRPTARLAKKLRLPQTAAAAVDVDPYADWSACVFTAGRLQYVLFTNTLSLYSAVLPGRGVTSAAVFLEQALDALSGVLRVDGLYELYPQRIAPAAAEVTYAKALNRSVSGSMAELVRLATYDLAQRGLSPVRAAQEINVAPMRPMLAQGYGFPRDVFEAMASGSA